MRISTFARPKKYKNFSLKRVKKKVTASAEVLLNKINQSAQGKLFYKAQLEVYETLNIRGMRELKTEHEALKKIPVEDLVGSKLLRQINRELMEEEKEKRLYKHIMETITTIMQSDSVSLHTYIPEKNGLKLKEWRGLHNKSAELWKWIGKLDESIYARAVSENKRIFVLNINHCDWLLDSEVLNSYRLSGICSTQSVPLFTHSGELLGVLSTHWNRVYEPSERDFALLDAVIRQTAALWEQINERASMLENKIWLIGQKEAFHAAMNRKPLEISLRALIDIVVLQTRGSAKAAFYLISAESNDFHNFMDLSEEHAGIIKCFPEEDQFVDLALLIKNREPIITPDIELDPAWENLRPLARKHNCRACWSFPLLSTKGILGTLGIYFPEPRQPTTRELEMASVLTHAAAIIVSLDQELVARRQTEIEMRKSEQKLTDQMRLRDEFIANASHELNSPLMCSMMYARIMENSFQEHNGPFQIEILNMLKKQLTQLNILIKEMLAVEAGAPHLKLNMAPFNLNEMIIEKVQSMQLITKKHQLETQLSSEDEIEADKDRLGQVITNLISNAIKYSPNGGEIIIMSEVIDSSIQVSIKDNGLGIAREDLENIFERYYRAPNDKIAGMGIGLSICKEIITQHQGTLTVTSQEGEGSTFSFIVPRHPALNDN